MYSNTRLVDVITKIDHEKGVVSIISSYVIDMKIITSLVSRLLLRHITNVITALSTLLMWMGHPIKVVVQPTKIIEGIRTVTSFLGIVTNVVTVPMVGGTPVMHTETTPAGRPSGAQPIAKRLALPL